MMNKNNEKQYMFDLKGWLDRYYSIEQLVDEDSNIDNEDHSDLLEGITEETKKEFFACYFELDPLTKKKCFPEGYNEAAMVGVSIARILTKESLFSERELLEMYIDTAYMIDKYLFTAYRVSDYFKEKKNQLDEKYHYLLYLFTQEHLTNHQFYINGKSKLDFLEEQKEELDNQKKIQNSLSRPKEPSYGFSADNPIMVKSLTDEYALLDNFIYLDGEIIKYERVASVESKMPDIVDLFSIDVKSRGLFKKKKTFNIFIDGYSAVFVDTAPKGFSYSQLDNGRMLNDKIEKELIMKDDPTRNAYRNYVLNSICTIAIELQRQPYFVENVDGLDNVINLIDMSFDLIVSKQCDTYNRRGGFSLFNEQHVSSQNNMLMDVFEKMIFGNNVLNANRANELPGDIINMLRKKLSVIGLIIGSTDEKVQRLRIDAQTEYKNTIRTIM